MRKILYKLIPLTVLALLAACSVNNGVIKEKRDGKIYKTVKIGNQIWIAENLNYKTEGSYCYDDDTANCDKYGSLYTWEAAMTACPTGYHLPSDAEWDVLLKFVLVDNNLGATNNAGTYLKSKIDWPPYDDFPEGNDKYGFNGLPAGSRDSDGSYYDMGEYSRFWSSTEYASTGAYGYNLSYDNGGLNRSSDDKTLARSIRCLKD